MSGQGCERVIKLARLVTRGGKATRRASNVEVFANYARDFRAAAKHEIQPFVYVGGVCHGVSPKEGCPTVDMRTVPVR